MQPRDVLRRYPLFDVLDRRWLDGWLESGVECAYATGDVLFEAGTPGTHLYLVLEGRVRVLRRFEGQEVSVGRCRPGDLLGEYALLPPGSNTATGRGAERGRFVRWPLAPLRDRIAAMPAVAGRLKRWLRLHALLGLRRGGLLLGFMSPASLTPLLERCETTALPAARVIQAEGLSDDCWYVIQTGEVCVHPGPDDPHGEPFLLGPGDSFGARALLDGTGLPLAVAHADSECQCLRRASFNEPLGGGAGTSVQTFRGHWPAPGKARPWIGQQDANDCGAAALAMIAHFYGHEVPLATLRSHLPLTGRGASLAALQQAARTAGFRSHAVRVGTEQLRELTLPAIAHLHGGHYVVLYALDGNHVTLGDPARGLITVEPPEFRTAWTGNVLLMLPTAA